MILLSKALLVWFYKEKIDEMNAVMIGLMFVKLTGETGKLADWLETG